MEPPQVGPGSLQSFWTAPESSTALPPRFAPFTVIKGGLSYWSY